MVGVVTVSTSLRVGCMTWLMTRDQLWPCAQRRPGPDGTHPPKVGSFGVQQPVHTKHRRRCDEQGARRRVHEGVRRLVQASRALRKARFPVELAGVVAARTHLPRVYLLRIPPKLL